MKKLVVATNNSHKLQEIREILMDESVEVLSLKDLNIDIDVVEDRETFLGNAEKKAREIYDHILSNGLGDYMVMADDSGLSVDYLHGAPGVYSARYSGEHGNTAENNKKLLKELKGVPKEKRGARFICSIVLIISPDNIISVEGESHGYIIEELKGEGGFGYDPLFYVPEFTKTFAEMEGKEKNLISHRGRALQKLKKELSNKINY